MIQGIPYLVSKSDIPKFSNFRKLEEDQVRKLVISTKSMSCELDPILITLLQKFYLAPYQQKPRSSTYHYNHAYFLEVGKQQ